jgi:two-component system response regulator
MERPLVVLLVEDSPSDRRLTTDMLEGCGLSIQLHCVEDGSAALAFLRAEGNYEGCPRPDIVLLDLGLPGMSGRDVLAELAGDAELKSIPVLVQTASDDDRTLVETLGLGAHEFAAKPLSQDTFLAVVEYITEFA